MCNGQPQNALGNGVREGSIGALRVQIDIAANKRQIGITQEPSGYRAFRVVGVGEFFVVNIFPVGKKQQKCKFPRIVETLEILEANTMNALHISNISKKYSGKTVLNALQCSVDAGSCFWLVGRNGAGKSTLINILADLIAPDSGTVTFGGLSYATDELAIKRNLGVLPDKNPAIPQLTGWEYLQFVGLLHELPPDECKRRAESLLAYFFDETEDTHKRIGTYSHGMTKKIGLCAALLHRPQYLILDEPFAGLDPVSSAKLVQFLQSYLSPERAIFLSSHDLGYAQKIMTHIGILENGTLQFVGSAEDFASSKHTLEESILQILQPKESNIHELNWLLQ